jgi:hypothetical protein
MHSKTENKRDIRKTVDFDLETYRLVDEMATVKNCSFSYMVYVLLQSAIREKQRKRSKADPQHNPTDAHPHNAG